jgi:hypothetical protein
MGQLRPSRSTKKKDPFFSASPHSLFFGMDNSDAQPPKLILSSHNLDPDFIPNNTELPPSPLRDGQGESDAATLQ